MSSYFTLTHRGTCPECTDRVSGEGSAPPRCWEGQELQPPALPIQLRLWVSKTKAKDSLQREAKKNEKSGERTRNKEYECEKGERSEKCKLRGEGPNRLVSLTPAPGSMPGPRGGTAGNTRSPTAGLDLPLPVPASPAAPEEATPPGAPDPPPVWPCSGDSNVWR